MKMLNSGIENQLLVVELYYTNYSGGGIKFPRIFYLPHGGSRIFIWEGDKIS